LHHGQKAKPALPDSEMRRRRDLIPGMFATPEFRAAFDLD